MQCTARAVLRGAFTGSVAQGRVSARATDDIRGHLCRCVRGGTGVWGQTVSRVGPVLRRGMSGNSGEVPRQNPFVRFASWYNACLTARPLLTTAMSTGAISAIGDTGSQLFVERYSEWDAARTLRFSVLGLVLTGPTLHFWYGFLFRRLPGVTVTRVLQRVALDQFFFAPLFTFSFISVLFAAEQRSYESWSSHMANNFAESVGVNWMMWIPAQVINFRFIPASYSVLFANFVAVFWNSYLSWNAHRDIEH
eukprot:m.186767 g.186767  ORF g.186767 m.186767 type:complete len:251 (+) comp16869_c0_seq1:123-875(+)